MLIYINNKIWFDHKYLKKQQQNTHTLARYKAVYRQYIIGNLCHANLPKII